METAAKKSREGWDLEAMEELGKIMKCKDVSLETKAKVINTLVFSITMHDCESWTVKKADKKKKPISLKMVLEENSTYTLDCQKDECVGPGAN